MNAEKELLLALLIEKYGQKPKTSQKTVGIFDALNNHAKKSKRVKRRIVTHSWTDLDNRMLIEFRGRGMVFAEVAKSMTQYHTSTGQPAIFTSGQCHSQWHNLQNKLKLVSNG